MLISFPYPKCIRTQLCMRCILTRNKWSCLAGADWTKFHMRHTINKSFNSACLFGYNLCSTAQHTRSNFLEFENWLLFRAVSVFCWSIESEWVNGRRCYPTRSTVKAFNSISLNSQYENSVGKKYAVTKHETNVQCDAPVTHKHTAECCCCSSQSGKKIKLIVINFRLSNWHGADARHMSLLHRTAMHPAAGANISESEMANNRQKQTQPRMHLISHNVTAVEVTTTNTNTQNASNLCCGVIDVISWWQPRFRCAALSSAGQTQLHSKTYLSMACACVWHSSMLSRSAEWICMHALTNGSSSNSSRWWRQTLVRSDIHSIAIAPFLFLR